MEYSVIVIKFKRVGKTSQSFMQLASHNEMDVVTNLKLVSRRQPQLGSDVDQDT